MDRGSLGGERRHFVCRVGATAPHQERRGSAEAAVAGLPDSSWQMGDRVVDDPAALANLLRSPSQVLQLTPAERLLMGVPEERKQRINQLMAMLTNRPGPSVPARPSALDEASWANASSSAYFSAADGLDLPSAPKVCSLLLPVLFLT